VRKWIWQRILKIGWVQYHLLIDDFENQYIKMS
jgi:hypothetical protein